MPSTPKPQACPNVCHDARVVCYRTAKLDVGSKIDAPFLHAFARPAFFTEAPVALGLE